MINIKEYKQFAVDNWYKFPDFTVMENISFCQDENMILLSLIEEWEQLCDFNTIEIITSKSFIEAIARGLNENKKYRIYYWYDKWAEVYLKDSIDGRVEELTLNQAIVIKDNKLEEFITNLI